MMATRRFWILDFGFWITRSAIIWMVAACGFIPLAHAAPSFEERFFAECARSRRLTIHHEDYPFDLHTILYTSANLMELEVFRLIDWVIDLPFPGKQVRPCEWTIDGIRHGYHRLGTGWPLPRVGEFVDALQIPELSLGDAASVYTVTSGGTVSAGSGTMVRLNKLIDWTQHLVGDLNGATGRVVGRRRGLVPWSWPGGLVDGVQVGVVRTFHGLSLVIVRGLDRSVQGIETVADVLVNVGRQTPHRERTVFLRMPASVYRAQEAWASRHRWRVFVTTEEELRQVTHAQLFHPRDRRFRLRRWSLTQFDHEPDVVIVVTDTRAFARAPHAWQPYVIPVTWFDAPASASASSP